MKTKVQPPADNDADSQSEKSSPAEVEAYRKAAESGDATAQCILGSCYKYEDGVELNHVEAARWFRIAAENGNGLAQSFFGFCYVHGEGVETDYSAAIKWFSLAAEQGDDNAKSTLKELRVVCDGIEMSLSDAADLSRLKASLDQAKAKFEFLLYTDSVKENPAMSFSQLRKAAMLGHPQAQLILASCYETGRGTEKNVLEAVKWYHKAAENGDPDAQFNLGNRYFSGNAVEKCFVEAEMWYRKAAKQGNEAASNMAAELNLIIPLCKSLDEQSPTRQTRVAKANQGTTTFMYPIIALGFCLLLGVMLKSQGIAALLWVPIGFAFGLFVTAQIVLPLMLGLPRAIRLVSTRQMRAAVFGRIILTPLIWLVQLAVVTFLVGWFWPSAADWLYNNAALNLSANLGMIAIILSPLSKKCRSDFRADFDKSYHRFYTVSDESHPTQR